MSGRNAFLPVYDKQCDHPQYDEGEAQQLTHIQHHVGLEVNLWFFNKFYQEPEAENQYHEHGKEETWPGLSILPEVGPPQINEDEQIGNGFIYLGGMLG